MRRHPFDPWSFVLGGLFLGTGIAFLTGSVDLLHTNAARLWPAPVLAIGLLIVFTSLGRARARRAAPVAVEGEAVEGEAGEAVNVDVPEPPA